MAGVSHSLDDGDARAALRRLKAAAREQQREVMHAIGAHFVFSTQRNFERETSPGGQRWPRLSPRTANKRLGRSKQRRGYDHMLRVKNRLHASIAYRADDTSVEWGSNLAYSRVHQLGGTIDMPPRQGKVSLKSVRRKGGGIRSRFARTGAKGAVEKAVSIRGHRIVIPARPYLGVSGADVERVAELQREHLERKVGGRR